MCHPICTVQANNYRRWNNKTNYIAYRVDLPSKSFATVRVILRHADKKWEAIIPYGKVTNRRTIVIVCMEDGTPIRHYPDGRRSRYGADFALV